MMETKFNLDIQHRQGKCDNCGMKGRLFRKTVIRPIDVSSIDGDPSAPLPTLDVCPTCFDTPAGAVSENVSHKRLPAEEYAGK